MKPNILLINPPIYDFTAYDFWLRPYGMLVAAAPLAAQVELHLFDYLDRRADDCIHDPHCRSDAWHRGHFPSVRIDKPGALADIPRRFQRFGRPRRLLQGLLQKNRYDIALIQTVMTYWYPGVQEVIEDLRMYQPGIKIVLGGLYTQICPQHAQTLGADLIVPGDDLRPVYDLLDMDNTHDGQYHPPCWHLYDRLVTGVMTLTRGCPFDCTYCCMSILNRPFAVRPLEECIADLECLLACGVRDIAFYDDALLVQPEKTLLPLLDYVSAKNHKVNFHTPNGLHARCITRDLAEALVKGGFKTFYLGFESRSGKWQAETGGKVQSDDLAVAIENLLAAGARRRDITAYEILGHPKGNLQDLEASMRFVHSLGIRIMLADFSPIPGTADGESCRRWTDLDEPLNHNKTAFPIRLLGNDHAQYFKDLAHELNGC